MRQCFEDCRLYCQRSCLMISGYFHFRGRAVCTPCISDAPRCFRAVFRKPVTGLFYFFLRFISVWNIIKKNTGQAVLHCPAFFHREYIKSQNQFPNIPTEQFRYRMQGIRAFHQLVFPVLDLLVRRQDTMEYQNHSPYSE